VPRNFKVRLFCLNFSSISHLYALPLFTLFRKSGFKSLSRRLISTNNAIWRAWGLALVISHHQIVMQVLKCSADICCQLSKQGCRRCWDSRFWCGSFRMFSWLLSTDLGRVAGQLCLIRLWLDIKICLAYILLENWIHVRVFICCSGHFN